MADHRKIKIMKEQIVIFSKKYNLNVSIEEKTLPIMYWLSKSHKNQVCHAKYIVTSENCSTKAL